MTIHDLKDGYELEKSDWLEFSRYFAVYEVYHSNLWFRHSFEQSCLVLKDCDICYWIKKDGSRIGGVLIEPNYMNCLFLLPPNNEYDVIINKLKQLLIRWSDKDKKIYLGGATPSNISFFLRQGFKAGESRRCMIRPTDTFDVNWQENYELKAIGLENVDAISKLFEDSFLYSDKKSYDEHQRSVIAYIENNNDNDLANQASTLVYDIKTGELVGACLISIWEAWPNVYEVAVKPSHQNQGLAKNMIKRSLSILKLEYPVLRLFVTLGNDAEWLYHKMGFLSGIEWTEMYLPEEA